MRRPWRPHPSPGESEEGEEGAESDEIVLLSFEQTDGWLELELEGTVRGWLEFEIEYDFSGDNPGFKDFFDEAMHLRFGIQKDALRTGDPHRESLFHFRRTRSRARAKLA